jgi:hypothetical protein
MMHERILCDLPEQGCDFATLRVEAYAAFPNLVDLNEVDFDLDPNSGESGKRVAFYFHEGDAPNRADLAALLDAHDPTPAPVPAPRDWAAEIEAAPSLAALKAVLTEFVAR